MRFAYAEIKLRNFFHKMLYKQAVMLGFNHQNFNDYVRKNFQG